MIKATVTGDLLPPDLVLDVPDDLVQAVISSVMAGARDVWVKRAQERLSSSRRDYINGIQEVELEDMSGSISLVGQLPNMIEGGASAFDMHDTLLGPDVPIAMGPGQRGKHVTEDGKFWRVIPFRHQTPGTAGQGGGAPMGTQYAGHGGVADAVTLGKRVYAQARKLGATTRAPGGPTKWGDRLPSGMAPLLKPIHSTDIYAGMVRQEKKYASATQSSYVTFRVISENVPWKWQHPGIVAVNISDEVHAYVERVAPDAFLAAIGAL